MFLTPPDIIIANYHLYSVSDIVTKLLGQLKIDAGLVSQEWGSVLIANLSIDDIYIDDIRSGQLLSVPGE